MTDLAGRVISSISWNLVANILRASILLVRLIVLARWLPVEVFGTYGLASAIISLSLVFPGFGLGGAFLHRSLETQDETKAADTFFTMQLIFLSGWAFLLIVVSLIFAGGEMLAALIGLTFLMGGLALTAPATYILIRRVAHRRLATVRVLDAFMGTFLALAVATVSPSIWALLATDLSLLVVSVGALYCWRPVIRPRLRWHRATVRYYLSFGWRNLLANLIDRALDRIDDLWTGAVLGQTALGFYSRAYAVATYPRRIIMDPAKNVFSGAYAELKSARKELSKAVFRSNAALLRMSFLAGGALFVASEEFIDLVLTEKWLPMLTALRILLLFAVLDPSRRVLADLFIAVGEPQELIKSRSVQLTTLAGSLLLFGSTAGLAGVAISVDLALFVGLSVMVRDAREHVDFSLARLLGVPTLCLLTGVGLTTILASENWLSLASWQVGLAKIVVFSILYSGLLAALEYGKLQQTVAHLVQYRRSEGRRSHSIRDRDV